MRHFRSALTGLMITALSLLSLLVGPAPAYAASGYALTAVAASAGVTTSAKPITLTVTFRNNGKAVKKATAALQYLKGGSWVTEKKVAIRSGKGSVKVKHGVGDRTYRFTVSGKATSASFIVHFVPATFTIAGSGRGHGVGMSQYGAYELAREGRTAEQILTTYYPGSATDLAFNNPRAVKVQVLGPPSDSRRTTKLSITSGGFTVKDGASVLATTKAGTPVAIGVTGSKATAKVTLASGKTKTFTATRLGFTWNTTKATVTVAGAQGSYRYGNLQVTVLGNRPNVVNELKMNTEYLYGIDEMPSSWGSAAGKGLEALKAQVVAARSYVIVQALRWKTDTDPAGANPACDCQVFDDSRSQNFTGWKKTGGAGGTTWRKAVDATVIADTVEVLRPSSSAAGQIAETPYFAASGRYTVGGVTYSGTASNTEAFNTAPVAYLSHVDDPYSVLAPGNPYRSWSVKLSQAKVEALFGIGKIRSLKVTERSAGGLAKVITATSVTGATSTLPPPSTSEKCRTALGLPGAWVSGITGR